MPVSWYWSPLPSLPIVCSHHFVVRFPHQNPQGSLLRLSFRFVTNRVKDDECSQHRIHLNKTMCKATNTHKQPHTYSPHTLNRIKILSRK